MLELIFFLFGLSWPFPLPLASCLSVQLQVYDSQGLFEVFRNGLTLRSFSLSQSGQWI